MKRTTLNRAAAAVSLFTLLLAFHNCSGFEGRVGSINSGAPQDNTADAGSSGGTDPGAGTTDPLHGNDPLANNKKSIVVAFGDSLTRGGTPKDSRNTGIKGYTPQLQTLLGDGYAVLNCGIGGQTTTDALNRYFEIIEGKYSNCTRDVVDSADTAAFYDYSKYEGQAPQAIVIWLGANNLMKDTPNQHITIGEFRTMLSAAHEKNIQTVLLNMFVYGPYFGFSPADAEYNGYVLSRVQVFNTLIDQLSVENPNTPVVDTYAIIGAQYLTYTWDNVHLKAEAYVPIASAIQKALVGALSKVLFSAEGGNPCRTGLGFAIPHGVATCSCASGTDGLTYMCSNGSFNQIGRELVPCASVEDHYRFVTYHCN